MKHIHFKMETLYTAINAMRENCYFGSVDLSEAFYSIPIHESCRKYFRFWFQQKKYQFTSLVMGLATSPRVFTKILKPVFAHLRSKGYVSTAYIDDSCLQGSTYQECQNNINATVALMDSLGLTVNLTKSMLVPCQQIVFLGFILCSVTMSITLTPERCKDIIDLCKRLLKEKRVTIRQFSQLIGKLVAAEPGVEYAPLFYKPLEKVKESALRAHKGKFESFLTIPKQCEPIIRWWIDNLPNSSKKVSHGKPDLILFSDASGSGWGGYNETENLRLSGVWDSLEQTLHINILEIKACQLTITSFCNNKTSLHVRIYTDNTTTCAYINKFGGKHSNLDDIARDIWLWCVARNIHLTAAHIPGKENTVADKLSRSKNDDLEWALKPNIFSEIHNIFPKISIDLFASKANSKLQRYVSRYPDPSACAVDAFSLTWNNEFGYIFPPFSLIPRILRKVVEDQAEVILIAPIWPTQSWWPSLLHLICGDCYRLPKVRQVLSLPHKPEYNHPLPQLNLGLFQLSGNVLNTKEYQNERATSLLNRGEKAQRNNTTLTSKNGSTFVTGKLTLFNPTSIIS
jgi:hypothetical protein